MDLSQDLLRTLSQHRYRLVPEARSRPVIRLACWKCGDIRQMPRPDEGLPCDCGGVFIEITGFEDDSDEDDE